MWIEHWGLSADPFPDQDTLFVPLPGHVEAVARLSHAVEAGHRLAVLGGATGLGKTRVLRQALTESRTPARRVSLVTSPVDEAALIGGLADGLRLRSPVGDASPSACWRALEQGIRICALQGMRAVLAVDDGRALAVADGAGHLYRLVRLGGVVGCPVTVLLVDGQEEGRDPLADADWTLAVKVKPLTRTEAEAYLTARLAAAGDGDSPFTARAIARLHLLSGGVPRGLNRLASLCLMAGAIRGLEAVSSELVDTVVSECHAPASTHPVL